METVLEYGIGQRLGRVFMDVWDIERFYECQNCSSRRAKRLTAMNLSQEIPPGITCDCGR